MISVGCKFSLKLFFLNPTLISSQSENRRVVFFANLVYVAGLRRKQHSSYIDKVRREAATYTK